MIPKYARTIRSHCDLPARRQAGRSEAISNTIEFHWDYFVAEFILSKAEGLLAMTGNIKCYFIIVLRDIVVPVKSGRLRSWGLRFRKKHKQANRTDHFTSQGYWKIPYRFLHCLHAVSCSRQKIDCQINAVLSHKGHHGHQPAHGWIPEKICWVQTQWKSHRNCGISLIH